MPKRNVFNSPRLLELKKERRRAVFGKVFAVCVLLLVIFASLVYFSRLERFGIKAVEVSGNKITEKEIIKEAVERELRGRYLWLIPKATLLTFPEKETATVLMERFKIIRNIDFNFKNSTLEVAITEREAKYTWCGIEAPEVMSKQDCYFVDESGYVFSLAPYFSRGVYFKFFGPNDIDPADPTGTYLFNGNFPRILAFTRTLEELGMKGVALFTKDGKEVRVYLSKDKSGALGPQVIFNVDADFENLAANLETAVNTEPLMSNLKNKYSSLEYIDLRYGNKVYYRFK